MKELEAAKAAASAQAAARQAAMAQAAERDAKVPACSHQRVPAEAFDVHPRLASMPISMLRGDVSYLLW